LELFVTKGFAATKLEDVAKAAGVSKGLPYLYFKSKEELFKAVIVEAIGGADRSRANELVDAFEGTTEELLRELVAPSSAKFAESPVGGVIKLILAEAGNFPRRGALLLFELRPARPCAVRQDAAARVARGEIRADPDIDTAAIVSPSRWPCTPCGCGRSRRTTRPTDRQRPLLRRLHRTSSARTAAMTAKRKCCSDHRASPSCWQGGASPGRAQGFRQGASRARRPSRRAADRADRGRAAHHQAARLVDVVRFTGTTQPIDQTIVKAASPAPGRGAGARRRPRHQGPGAGALRDHRAAGQVNERQSALDAARADARWTARDRADKELSPRATSSRSRPPTRRARPRRTRRRWSPLPRPARGSPAENLSDAEVVAPFDGVVGERIANQANRCRSTARSWRSSTPAMSRSRPRCRLPTSCG
jgi:AcrR family transcriptional regulator